MRKKLFTIFKSTYLYSEKELKRREDELKNYLSDYYSEVTDDLIADELYDDERFSFSAGQHDLDKVLNGNIIAFIDGGFWNGRRHSISVLSKNLNSIMNFFGCDYINIYATRRGVYGEFYHHDGTHYVEFRELKDTDITNRYSVKFDTKDRKSISRNTRSLAPYINDIYGCFAK